MVFTICLIDFTLRSLIVLISPVGDLMPIFKEFDERRRSMLLQVACQKIHQLQYKQEVDEVSLHLFYRLDIVFILFQIIWINTIHNQE